tara:strand:+ start:44 stop:187 length:144 start_codon:yes stop_codon:yes gene_type:complete
MLAESMIRITPLNLVMLRLLNPLVEQLLNQEMVIGIISLRIPLKLNN